MKLGVKKVGLVVKTNVVALVKKVNESKGSQVNSVADNFVPAVEVKVKKLIEEAVERARANGRKTLMDKDV